MTSTMKMRRRTKISKKRKRSPRCSTKLSNPRARTIVENDRDDHDHGREIARESVGDRDHGREIVRSGRDREIVARGKKIGSLRIEKIATRIENIATRIETRKEAVKVEVKIPCLSKKPTK